MKTIFINSEAVELYKILKFESLVYGGGEAKTVISGGLVSVNGEVETQKRKKIVSGDVIEFDGQRFSVKVGDKPPQPSDANNNKPSPLQPEYPEQVVETVVKKPKRTAIRF